MNSRSAENDKLSTVAKSAPPRLQRPALVRSRDRLLALAVFVVALVVTLPPEVFSPQQVIAKYRVLDTSWQLSMPMLLRDGKLSGRDFIYTYGPVYQFTQALGLAIPPGDVASVSRFRSLPERVIVLSSLWWVLSLTGASVRYRGAVFLMWCVIMAAPVEFHALRIKPMFGIPAAALCGLLLSRASSSNTLRTRVPMLLVWGAAGPLLTLYSFDFGIIFAATLIATALIFAVNVLRLDRDLVTRHRIAGLTAAASTAIGMAMLLGGTQLIPGWENYTPDMFALVTAYGNAMALSGTTATFLTLALAFCASGGLLLFELWRSPLPTSGGEDTVSIQTATIAMACFGLFMVRYGLTRTDWFHVHTAIVPAMFLFGCMVPALLYARRRQGGSRTTASSESDLRDTASPSWAGRAAFALPALVLVAPMFFEPFAVPCLAGWELRLRAMSRFSLEPTSIRCSDETLARAAAAAATLPNRSLFVWPYGVELNLLADKDNPTYTLQSAEGAIGTLEGKTIDRLREADDVAALLYRDAKGGASMSRTSDIFRYLLDGYELSHAPESGFALLRRKPQETTWDEIEIELPTPAPVFNPGKLSAVQVSLDGYDCRVSDILMARLHVSKTSNIPVGKPGILFAVLALENEHHIFPVLQVQPDGQSHDVLICGINIDDDRCLSHFVPDRTWRTIERVKILQLSWRPRDLLSKVPAEIRLERLAILRRTGGETRETPLDEKTNPDMWQWCYGPLPKMP